MKEGIAPPPGTWKDHLKDLDEKALKELACDYRWLDERSRAGESQREFKARREAIIEECERRGLPDLARECRPAA